jgi:WD40 repeat protein
MILATLNRLLRLFAPCAALVIAFAAPSSAHAQEKVTYQDHVLPIFRNACNNCHNPDKKKAGLDLTTFQSTLAGGDNGSVINAGDPSGSKLYKVITHADEPTMPPKRDKLAQAELETVRKWIAGGLLDTANGKAAPMSKPKIDLGAVVVSGKPTGPAAMPKDLIAEPIVRTQRPGAVESLASSPWAPVIAVGGQKQIVLYHSQSLDVLGILPFNEGVPRVLQFSRNGTVLLAAGGQGAKLGKVVLFDVATGNRLTDIGDELDEVLAADISGDQKIVALGGPSRLVKGYDVADGKELYSIKKHTDWVTAVAMSPNGEYLASGDRAGNLYVFEAKTGGEVYNLSGHKEEIDALCFRGDSQVLMSASKDGTVKLWEMAEGKNIKSINAHNGGVTSAVFAHDGAIVTCGRDKTVKVWDAAGNTPKPLAPAFNELAMHVTFDSEGQRVFAGDWSGVLRVWQISDGKVLGELSPNPPRISDRLEAAIKKLAESEPAIAKAEAELKAAKEAAAKADAENKEAAATVEKAKQAIVDAEARVKTADADIAAKAANSGKGAEQIVQKRQEVDRRTKALEAAEQAAKEAELAARTAAENSKSGSADLKALEADVTAKQTALAEARKILADAEAALKGKPEDAAIKSAAADAKARVDRRSGRLADARKALETAKANSANGATNVKTIKADPSVVKAVADAKTALEKAQSELKATEKANADDKATVDKLSLEKAEAAKAVNKAKAELPEFLSRVKPKSMAANAAAEKVAPVQKAFDDLQASLGTAKYDIARLKAAQAGSLLAEAKKSLKQREDAKTAAEQAAKDAIAAVEKGKSDIAAFKKSRDESPAKVQQLKTQLEPLRKALADVTIPADGAAKDVAEREAIATQAAELARHIGEQIQKTKEPGKDLTDAEATAKKVIEQLAGDLNAAKEKAAKWENARKKAETELNTVEQAIVKERTDTENAGKITEDLNKALAAAEADVPVKQAAAKESVKPIEEAKKKVEEAKAEQEKLTAEAAKIAPVASK